MKVLPGILPLFAGAVLLFSALPPAHAFIVGGNSISHAPSLYDMELEDLMQITVVTATKSPLKLQDAPSAMTVITGEDIRRYGYRTLAEALARTPEVYSRFEGHNQGCDFRGFFTNNTRRQVLFLLNGHRINDRFHFGDFYPDVIGDLTAVERIEVIRGPGAAIYGNNAILGVVNIITRDAAAQDIGATEAGAAVSVDQVANASGVFKVQADLYHRFSKNTYLSFDTYWFDGEARYDTRTSRYVRPWDGSEARGGPGKTDVKTRPDVYLDVPDASFDGGMALPSYNLRLTAGEITLGSFSHTRLSSWVWPRDNITFGHPDNIRSWGTGAAFMEWAPEGGALSEYDILARVSYNINTNREITDFSTADRIGEKSLFHARLTGIYSGQRWLMDRNGGFYNYVATLDPVLFADETADAAGGGSQFHYAGVDKSVGLEFQFTPWQNDVFTLQAGANYEDARYENLQWYAHRNGDFIGWAPWGGITDKGWYAGGWLQATYRPAQRLFFIGGARYDYQKIDTVYRQLGGEQLYREQDGQYVPIRKDDAVAKDLSPRLSVNYYFNDTDNIRLIYAKAFRAVPPQELIRLPADFGEAKSEETENYEIIGAFKLSDRINMTLNVFHLESNIIYQWNPAVAAFSKGSGWRNTGGSAAFTYVNAGGLEAWSNLTLYRLRRPTNALQFMKDEPNRYKSLDSPGMLFKTGASYRTRTLTTVGAELYYNSSITMLAPGVNNVEDAPLDVVYRVYEVPASFFFNLAIRQDLSVWGLNGWFCQLKVDNVLDTDVWYGLNMDAQSSWDYDLYSRPNQLPGFGRRFYAQLGARF